MSNGQRRPNAAARLAALPLVASVGTKLSVVYTGAKCCHPGLRSVCEGLESGVAAVLSPVTGKLEPHISIANEVACQILDWLETALPRLHTPTEQLVATAKKVVAEIQDVVSVAANASADCVITGVAWLVARLEGARDRGQPLVDTAVAAAAVARLEGARDRGQPLVDTAVAAAAVGLDTALATSEALVDRMLPPAEDNTEKKETVQRFEVTLQRSYPERLFALATKLYSRMFSMNCRFALIRTILKLPQHLRHQLVSTIVSLSQTHNCPTNSCQRLREPSRLHAPEIRYLDSPETTPPSGRLRRPVLENVCSVKGCVDR